MIKLTLFIGGVINAILLATTGKVTATLEAGDAAAIKTALADTVVNNIAVTVNGLTAAATDLLSIIDKTSAKVKVDAVAITGTVADLTKVYVTNKSNFTALGNEDVSITPVAPATHISASDVNSIAKATTGTVAATVTAGRAADLFADLRDATSKDALYLSTSIGTDTAAELLALDNKTSIIVNASATTGISGTAAELKKVFASSGIKVDGDLVITVTDTASAADVNAIAAKTTSAVTATIEDGSVAATLKALSDVKNTDIIRFKTTDKSVKASDLVDLAAKLANPSSSFDKSKIETITGTAAETGAGKAIPLALTALGATTNAEVKITGNVPVANILLHR